MIQFWEWMAELIALAEQHNWPLGDEEAWRCYWSDGYAPEQALQEEMSYAENDYAKS